MANSKITELTATTSATTDDILPIVDDPAGTPTTKKITFDNLQKSITTVGKVAVTQPATGATITITDGKTLTVSNNATVSGTNTGDQDLSGYQPLDSDLTTIAGLTATTDNFIQSKASAWASRTPAQVTADLSTMVGDSGSGGTKGLVPAPAAGDAAASKFLKADGTWAAASGGSSSPSFNTFSTIFESVSSRYTLTQSSSGTVTANTGGVRLATNSGNTAIAKLLLPHSTTSGLQNIFDGSSSFSILVSTLTGSTGTGYQWFGISQDSSNMLHTDTTKGYWFVKEVVAGTSKLWAVNADNTSVTATDVSSGLTLTNGHVFSAVKDSTTNIKFYVDSTLVATHTTNLPTGQTNSNDFFILNCSNVSGDSTARILDVANLTITYPL